MDDSDETPRLRIGDLDLPAIQQPESSKVKLKPQTLAVKLRISVEELFSTDHLPLSRFEDID